MLGLVGRLWPYLGLGLIGAASGRRTRGSGLCGPLRFRDSHRRRAGHCSRCGSRRGLHGLAAAYNQLLAVKTEVIAVSAQEPQLIHKPREDLQLPVFESRQIPFADLQGGFGVSDRAAELLTPPSQLPAKIAQG